MKLTINRPNWYRGRTSAHSSLLRKEDGMMCCLGFLALACGATKEQIENVPSPNDLAVKFPLPEGMRFLVREETSLNVSDNTEECIEMMVTNDQEEGSRSYRDDTVLFSEKEREERLSRIFAKHGIEVEFTDEPLEVK